MNDGLQRQIKAQAEREGKSFTQAIEEAGSLWLASRRPSRATKKCRVSLPTFRGDGVHAGVDLNDSSKLFDELDAGISLEKRR